MAARTCTTLGFNKSKVCVKKKKKNTSPPHWCGSCFPILGPVFSPLSRAKEKYYSSVCEKQKKDRRAEDTPAVAAIHMPHDRFPLNRAPFNWEVMHHKSQSYVRQKECITNLFSFFLSLSKPLQLGLKAKNDSKTWALEVGRVKHFDCVLHGLRLSA